MTPAMKALAAKIREENAGDWYAQFHAPRWAILLDLLTRYVKGPETRVLDIGKSQLTGLVRERFGTQVDSLGFWGDRQTEWGQSYWFDLNAAQKPETWRRDLPTYDVIIMAEVIEHLHTAPTLVLRFLRTLVAPGGVLIVQTPNALALHKRIKLLVGKHPYEMIREDTADPGHFREYTRREMEQVAREAGFRVDDWNAFSYFDYRHLPQATGRPAIKFLGGLMNAAYRVLPTSVRPGQTVVLRPLS